MPAFSDRSRRILRSCDPQLQQLFIQVVNSFDCAVISGYRGEAEQDVLYYAGKSKVRFPESKHNSSPSRAIDVIPYPIDWKDRERMNYFAGYVMGVARHLGYKIRWGGDWDMDWQVRDNVFDDLVHFELTG